MNFTCSKCKNEFDYQEDHLEMNFPGLQLFLCKECIHRERSKREDSNKECEEFGHMNTWMPKNQVLCMRCGALNTVVIS